MPLPNDDEPQRSGEKLEEEEPQDGGKTPNTATYQNSQTLKKKWTAGAPAARQPNQRKGSPLAVTWGR